MNQQIDSDGSEMPRKRTWKMVYRAPHQGHKFFIRYIGDPSIEDNREALERVYVADNSGGTPDQTEDGIMWVDASRPIVVGATSFSIPVIEERKDRRCWTGESNDALIDLVRVLKEMSVNVTVELEKNAGISAKALVKCLELGIVL